MFDLSVNNKHLQPCLQGQGCCLCCRGIALCCRICTCTGLYYSRSSIYLKLPLWKQVHAFLPKYPDCSVHGLPPSQKRHRTGCCRCFQVNVNSLWNKQCIHSIRRWYETPWRSRDVEIMVFVSYFPYFVGRCLVPRHWPNQFLQMDKKGEGSGETMVKFITSFYYGFMSVYHLNPMCI